MTTQRRDPHAAQGSTVWVTARASNALLAFSAARLRSDPGRPWRP